MDCDLNFPYAPDYINHLINSEMIEFPEFIPSLELRDYPLPCRVLRVIFFISIPSMTGLIILRHPIITLLFQRGEFEKTIRFFEYHWAKRHDDSAV